MTTQIMGVRVSALQTPMTELTLWQVVYVFGEGVLEPEVTVDPPGQENSNVET